LARNHFLAPDFPLESFVILYAIFTLLVGWFSAVRRRAERLLTEARDNLEFRVAERTGELTNANEQLESTQAELRRREAYLAEVQGLSHTGSFGWSVISQDIYWSEETYNTFEQDRDVKPTSELLLQRVHPDDRDLVQQTMARASETEASFDLGHRLLMPDGSVKHLNVSARSLKNSSGELEFVGAVTDVTAATQARSELERAFEEIEGLKDRLQNENVALREEIDKASMFEEIIGTSSPLQMVLSRISKVALTDSSVLITGETGTGKELVARAIHRLSRRSSHAIVSVDCAAVPRDLIASELFGHEKEPSLGQPIGV
jgi:PAS domain-containing protein